LLGQRAFLARRQTAGPQDEAANVTPCLHEREVCLI
jgi:hypothetical protein